MADWAIAMEVGGRNNGQEVFWPQSTPPDWYAVWSRQSFDQLTENDWVRQAVSQRIHCDPAKLLAEVETMVSRAARMKRAFQGTGASREILQLVADRESQLRALGGG